MVQLNSSFDKTRFASWKRGCGFGSASRDYLNDPAIVTRGRSTPTGDRFFSHSRFWKTGWEMEQASSFGFGDRPDYGKSQGSNYTASPDSYTPNVSSIKKDVIYKGLTIKDYFPSPEQKYKWNAIAGGPGPGSYNVRLPPGATMPKLTVQTKHLDVALVKEEQFKPGPDTYTTQRPTGYSKPKFLMRCRDKASQDMSQKIPGPGQYNLKGTFDKFNKTPAGWIPPWVVELMEMSAKKNDKSYD